MEMQTIATQEEKIQDAETSGLMEEAKAEDLEEAQQCHYSKLQSSNEDVYSEVLQDATDKKKAERKTEGKTRLYRVACIFLTILCLLLLATIIILSVLLTQTGSTVCPGKGEDGATSQLPRTCSLEECQANFVTSVPQYWRCTDCPEGWLKLDQWCFLLSTFRLSWDESRRNCSSKGASLAVISSKTVQDFLSDNGAVKYWIGLRRIGDTWTWTDNALLKQSYWADDASDKDCVVLSSTDSPGKNWIKKSCQAYTYFICQLHL